MRRIILAIAIAMAVGSGSLNVALVSAQPLQDETKESKKEKKAKGEKKSKEEKMDESSDEKMSKSDKKKDKKSGKSNTLYNRLGGKQAITAVVDEFINVVGADNRINKFFADTVKDPKRLEALKKNLVDQICAGTGGPCKYKGKDMKTAHQGMGITEADFGALAEDLVAALNKFKVPKAEQDELLAILGPMKADIVEK